MNDETRVQLRKERLQRGEYYVKAGEVVCSVCGSNCGQCADSVVPGPVPEGWEHYTDPDRRKKGIAAALRSLDDAVQPEPRRKTLFERFRDWINSI